MGFLISNISKSEKLVEGLNFIANGLPVGVWNTITLDPSTAGKKVQIHIANGASWRTGRRVQVRQIDDSGTPLGVGHPIDVGGKSTTSVWVTTNKNAEIQVRNGGRGIAYFHKNTLK